MQGRALGLALVAACAAVGLSACLPNEVEVQGQRLWSGRGIERLQFVRDRGATAVSFDLRVTDTTPFGLGTTDWWLVPVAGGAGRRVIDGLVDTYRREIQRVGPDENDFDSYLYYVARKAREGRGGSANTRTVTVTKLSPSSGVLEEVDGVLSYQVSGAPNVWLFRTPTANGGTPRVHLRNDRKGLERVFDDITGSAGFWGEDGLLYVVGNDRVLYQLPSIEATPQPLRAGVGRWAFIRGNRSAIMTVPENGRPALVLFDVPTRSERKIAGNPCCWLYWDNNTFVFAESATGQSPARLHTFNLNTWEDRVLDLPRELADVQRIYTHPKGELQLLVDSAGTSAVLQTAGDRASIRILPYKPVSPSWLDDARYFVYLEAENLVPEPEGRFMVVDGLLTGTPRQVSPIGALMRDGDYFALDVDGPPTVVFWARYGQGSSDLYFGDLDSATSKLVAEDIRDVSVSADSVLGILRSSPQDLVGDLVQRNLVTGQEVVISHAVEEFATGPDDLVAFEVKGRYRSEKDGLWVRSLKDPPVDAGAR